MFWDVTATVDGKEIEARTTPLDVMRWEADTGKNLPDEGGSFTAVFEISYNAFKRESLTELSHDEFALTVTGLETKSVKSGPTKRARSGKR